MIGIVDSGATKTEWCFLNGKGEEKRVVTGGLNPYLVGAEEIRNCLEKDLYPFIDNQRVKYLFFYGSGCADSVKRGVLQSELEEFFPKAEVNIGSDLSGAALALCGREPGMVAILGTGASTCFYDGENIKTEVPSLGYILGDEGSGARIGMHFLADYLRGGMPQDLRGQFAPLCPYPVHEIIDTVYHGTGVSRFLGEMAVFLDGRMSHPYVREVLVRQFTAFFKTQVLPYGEKAAKYPVNLVGSIAYFSQELLEEAAAPLGIRVGRVLKSPMDGLLEHYRPMLADLLREAPFAADDFS
ncbi:MAG: ATPase [Bacteroides sp.]|nr:ATPase [Bacteroides sp.]MCM1086398.1 ATPase [Bacteroides sp.]